MRIPSVAAALLLATLPTLACAENALFSTQSREGWVVEVNNFQFVIHLEKGPDNVRFDRIDRGRSFIDIRKRSGEGSPWQNYKRIKNIAGVAEEDTGETVQVIRFTLTGDPFLWDENKEKYDRLDSNDRKISMNGQVFVFESEKRLQLHRQFKLRADRRSHRAKSKKARGDDPCEEMPEEPIIEYSTDIGYDPPSNN